MRLKAIALVMMLGCCMGTGAAMQQSLPSMPSYGTTPVPIHNGRQDDDDAHTRMEAARAKSANVERQKQMTREATELVYIAGELQLKAQRNADAAAQAEMLRKLDAIEKLAHDVKERMKGQR